ncbi:hypothetical protein BJX62DRAFT_241388 [Aspergillus germanicus]
MEPLVAISLAGNIFQFIDFSSRVISGVTEVCFSASGMTAENASLSIFVKDLAAVTQNLAVVPAAAKTKNENERLLYALAAQCCAFSEELDGVLWRLRVGDDNNGNNRNWKWKGLVMMWQSMRKEKQIDAMERRLNGFQSQILIRLQLIQKLNAQSDFDSSQLELDQLHKSISTLVEFLQQSASAQDEKPQESNDGPLLGELAASLSEFQSVTTSLSRQNKVLERLAIPSMYNREGRIEKAKNSTFAWMVDQGAQSSNDLSSATTGSDSKDDDYERIRQWKRYEKDKTKQEALRQRTREEFLTWLNSGRHIFHILGKAWIGQVDADEVPCAISSGETGVGKLGWGSSIGFCSILLEFRGCDADVSRGAISKPAV